MEFNARLAGLGLLLVAGAALAQPIYRHVDAHGRVTFSDQPPTASTQPAASPAGPSSAQTGPTLPYELRQVTQRYPVTLYVGEACDPCNTGRSLLLSRGVPFEERTVSTPEDVDALERLSGQGSLPLLTIGAQQLKGFSDAEWSQYLDAAGYPKSIQLPTGYQRPAPQPLVALQAAQPQSAAPEAATASPAPPASAPASSPTPANPAGIRF